MLRSVLVKQSPFLLRNLASPLVAPQPRSSAWTPRSITATPLVYWHDPSCITTLFKDAAGTIPVTADGDEVLCMKDKSGNNNHATATAGSGPIYRSGGYLDLDGGRFMVTAAIQLTDGSGQHSAAAAVYFTGVASYQNVLDADNGGSTRLSQFLRCNPSGQLETIAFNTTPSAFTDTGPSIAAATGTVLSEITTATTTEAFVNGVGNGSTATSGTPASVASVLTIGAFDAGNSQFVTGKFCGSAGCQGAWSAGDHAQLVTFLTAKTIITINVFPPTGHLAFTGYQSAITLTTAVSPSTGHLIFGGKIPSVSVNFAVSPSSGHLVFTGKTPAVAFTTNVNPLTGHLIFGGHVPTVTLTTAVSPSTGHLTFGGKTPSVTLNVNVVPSTGHLTYSGKVPALTLGLTPITGHLLFTGYAPDVTGTTVSSSAVPLKVQFRHRNRNG